MLPSTNILQNILVYCEHIAPYFHGMKTVYSRMKEQFSPWTAHASPMP